MAMAQAMSKAASGDGFLDDSCNIAAATPPSSATRARLPARHPPPTNQQHTRGVATPSPHRHVHVHVREVEADAVPSACRRRRPGHGRAVVTPPPVADLASLEAFELDTPPRLPEDTGPGASCADVTAGPMEQDPMVEFLTRQVRSLQREKAEMGRENAALRREVRSLEDLVGSLEALLEDGSGTEEEYREPNVAHGEVHGRHARGAVEGHDDQGRRGPCGDIRSSRDDERDRLRGTCGSSGEMSGSLGKWLDATVALGLSDIERAFRTRPRLGCGGDDGGGMELTT